MLNGLRYSNRHKRGEDWIAGTRGFAVRELMTGGALALSQLARIAPEAFVGEVVMKTEYTPLLQAALAKGCGVQVGTDMLFEMIPAYLEFFGYGTATADELRAVAQIKY